MAIHIILQDQDDDRWAEFACVACGCTVHVLAAAMNSEHRCSVCEFIANVPAEHQDALRDRLIRDITDQR